MDGILPAGTSGSKPLSIIAYKKSYRNRVNVNKRHLTPGHDLDRLIQLTLALDTKEGWRRPAFQRLKSLDAELRSVFINAGLENFTNGSLNTLENEWKNHGSCNASVRTSILTDYIHLKLGVNLKELSLSNLVLTSTFKELIPKLKEALVCQEIERLVVTELGINHIEVQPSLALDPEKQRRGHLAINLNENQRREFLQKVAESFNINVDRLIKDFEASDSASIVSLQNRVFSQIFLDHGTKNGWG